MFETKLYEVYIKTENNFIIAVNSSEFLSDTSDWLKIDEGYDDRHHHAQGNYFPESIVTESGVYRYKYADGVAVECTADEIAAQEKANAPNTIAPHNILTGEYVTVNGVLYKATTNIPNGERIIVGQNAIETTFEAQLAELAKGE